MESNNKDSVNQNVTSRRKFLTTAAKSAAVISTVAAKPVWASNTSISGNLSGNLSGQRQHEEAYADGCSPGYYHAHFDKEKCPKSTFSKSNYPEFIYKKSKNSSEFWVYSRATSSKLPTASLYRKRFKNIFGIGYGPSNSRVYQVLQPTFHNSNNGITQIDRMVLTAYFNAHPTYSGVTNAYGNHGFPYTTTEIVEFYQRYIDSKGTTNEITESQMTTILDNLIHGGSGSSNWESWDATCR